MTFYNFQTQQFIPKTKNRNDKQIWLAKGESSERESTFS